MRWDLHEIIQICLQTDYSLDKRNHFETMLQNNWSVVHINKTGIRGERERVVWFLESNLYLKWVYGKCELKQRRWSLFQALFRVGLATLHNKIKLFHLQICEISLCYWEIWFVDENNEKNGNFFKVELYAPRGSALLISNTQLV